MADFGVVEFVGNFSVSQALKFNGQPTTAIGSVTLAEVEQMVPGTQTLYIFTSNILKLPVQSQADRTFFDTAADKTKFKSRNKTPDEIAQGVKLTTKLNQWLADKSVLEGTQGFLQDGFAVVKPVKKDEKAFEQMIENKYGKGWQARLLVTWLQVDDTKNKVKDKQK